MFCTLISWLCYMIQACTGIFAMHQRKADVVEYLRKSITGTTIFITIVKVLNFSLGLAFVKNLQVLDKDSDYSNTFV